MCEVERDAGVGWGWVLVAGILLLFSFPLMYGLREHGYRSLHESRSWHIRGVVIEDVQGRATFVHAERYLDQYRIVTIEEALDAGEVSSLRWQDPPLAARLGLLRAEDVDPIALIDERVILGRASVRASSDLVPGLGWLPGALPTMRERKCTLDGTWDRRDHGAVSMSIVDVVRPSVEAYVGDALGRDDLVDLMRSGAGVREYVPSVVLYNSLLLAVYVSLVPFVFAAIVCSTRSLRRGRRMEGCRCPTCGFDLRATARQRCPECGRTFSNVEWRWMREPA